MVGTTSRQGEHLAFFARFINAYEAPCRVLILGCGIIRQARKREQNRPLISLSHWIGPNSFVMQLTKSAESQTASHTAYEVIGVLISDLELAGFGEKTEDGYGLKP